jgi:YaiO family outer membrane protein
MRLSEQILLIVVTTGLVSLVVYGQQNLAPVATVKPTNNLKTRNHALVSAIERQPNDQLYYQLALNEIDMGSYAKAKKVLKHIHNNDQQYDLMKLERIIDKNLDSLPKNEIGYEQDEAYVSDINSYWSYIFLHYYRLTSAGKFGAHINEAKRYGNVGTQYVIEAYPTFGDSNYLALNVGYANDSQKVWPTRLYYIEPYFLLTNNIDASIGARMIKAISKKIYMQAASIGYYVGDYYLSVRQNHFSPKSCFYIEMAAKKYLEGKNHYLGAKVGVGETPDIADFAPLNQIIILHAKALNLEYQLPLVDNLYLKLVAGYTYQNFPGGLIRKITDGYINISWKF